MTAGSESDIADSGVDMAGAEATRGVHFRFVQTARSSQFRAVKAFCLSLDHQETDPPASFSASEVREHDVSSCDSLVVCLLCHLLMRLFVQCLLIRLV